MAIYRLVREAVFQPEEIARMTAAYEAALQRLQLSNRSDPITEVVAQKIIDVATAGERDPHLICSRALEEVGVPPTE